MSFRVSLGPFAPRPPECPKGVPRVAPECPGTFLTLRGHSRNTFWTLRARGAKGPRNTPKTLPGAVRVYRGTGVSCRVRRTTWERSLKKWELEIPCFEEFFGGGNTLALVPASLPHTLGYACTFYAPTSPPPVAGRGVRSGKNKEKSQNNQDFSILAASCRTSKILVSEGKTLKRAKDNSLISKAATLRIFEIILNYRSSQNYHRQSFRNPRAHKNKIGTAPPPPHKKPKIPPPKKRNFMDMGFSCRKNAFFQAPIKLAQPFPAPELRTNILRTRGFFWVLLFSSTYVPQITVTVLKFGWIHSDEYSPPLPLPSWHPQAPLHLPWFPITILKVIWINIAGLLLPLPSWNVFELEPSWNVFELER